MDKEEQEALELAFELHKNSVEHSNKILSDYREKLENENRVLREENRLMKSELDEIHYALSIIRGERVYLGE